MPDIALTTCLDAGRHEGVMKILDRVADRLGQVWLDLQDRYERGWSMLR